MTSQMSAGSTPEPSCLLKIKHPLKGGIARLRATVSGLPAVCAQRLVSPPCLSSRLAALRFNSKSRRAHHRQLPDCLKVCTLRVGFTLRLLQPWCVLLRFQPGPNESGAACIRLHHSFTAARRFACRGRPDLPATRMRGHFGDFSRGGRWWRRVSVLPDTMASCHPAICVQRLRAPNSGR